MREVEFVEDDFGHYVEASPKVTQGIAEVLSANRAIDRWASRVSFLLWRLVEYSCVTLFRELNDLHRGQGSFVVDDVLDVESISWHMHYIQK